MRSILVVIMIFSIVMFVADKLVLAPTEPATGSDVVARLARHDVTHATISAVTVTLESRDGTTRRYTIPAGRDLMPALRASGADITIARSTSRGDDAETPLQFALGFVPFVILALLLIVVLRRFRPSY